MFSRLFAQFRQVFRDQEVMKRIYLITLVTALLVLVLVIKGPEEGGKLLVDDSGNVVGIRRNSLSSSERYDVSLRVLDEENVSDRDLTVTIRALRDSDDDMKKGKSQNAVSREAEIEAEIDNMISEIEFSDQEVITLPETLPDGTPIIWNARDQEDRSGISVILVIYPVLIFLVIRSGMNAGKDEDAAIRAEIMKSLPRFCNQLFLMMNAGMILNDAFESICESYSCFSSDELGYFEKELIEIRDANSDHRNSTAALISEYASQHNVKELVRIAAILTENEKRGSNVVENLSRESRYLWDERKIVARERGKMIDARMSWPLAMLLIMLIVITMAPALMNI